jgi:hypothetical protein
MPRFGFADGGFTQSEMANAIPMAAGSAAVVGPGTLRVIGDNPTDDEAYIPINSSTTSTALLGYTANQMGFALAPMATGGFIKGFADGGTMTEQEYGASQQGKQWVNPQDPSTPIKPPAGGGGTPGGGHHGGGGGGLFGWIQNLIDSITGMGHGGGHTVHINMPIGTDKFGIRMAAKTMQDAIRDLERERR